MKMDYASEMLRAIPESMRWRFVFRWTISIKAAGGGYFKDMRYPVGLRQRK